MKRYTVIKGCVQGRCFTKVYIVQGTSEEDVKQKAWEKAKKELNLPDEPYDESDNSSCPSIQ